MRAARTLCAALLLGATVGRSAAGEPPVAAATPGVVASLEGVVRVAGVPAAARIEVRRLPTPEAPPPFRWDAAEYEAADDPTQVGVVLGAPVATAASAADGTYRVEGLPGGRYQLTVSAGEESALVCVAIEGGGAIVRDLAVAPGRRTLRGRVRWADGRPYRGTVVVSQPDEGRRATPWLDGAVSVETDKEGRFATTGLVAGRVDVSAVVPGRLRVTWARVLPSSVALVELALDRAAQEHAGRVVAGADEPVPGVPLVCRTALADGIELVAVSRADAEGRFRVLALPGPRGVTVRVPGFLPQADALEGAEIVARLVRAPVVRGVVRREGDGRPIEGAWVHAIGEGMWQPWARSAVTDSTGRYEIEGSGLGAVVVLVQGGGWVAADPAESPRVLRPGSVAEVDLEARHAGRATGRVVSEDGTPVVGARLDVRTAGDDAPRGAYRVLELLSTAATDGEGRFALDGLFPGARVTVGAASPLHRWVWAMARPGDVVDLALARRPPITGRVVPPVGVRPSGVWLTAEPAPVRDPATPTAPETPPLSSLAVAADGSFRVEPAMRGGYVVRASAWVGDAAWHGAAVGAPEKGDLVVPLSPDRPGARGWLFHVLDPDGRPVPAGDAILDESGPGLSATKALDLRDGEVAYWSDADETTVSLHVSRLRDAAGRGAPYAGAGTPLLTPGVHVVRLAPGRVVRGRLQTPDGAPVGLAEVQALPLDVPPEERRSDAYTFTDLQGRFELANLRLCDYEVHVWPPDGMSPVDPTVAPRDTDEIDVTVLPLVSARVEVRSPDDVAVEGARVRVWTRTGIDGLARGALDLRTDATGAVVLPPLPPRGRYAMRVDPPGEDALAIERAEWSPEPTPLRLPRADVLRGVVRDAGGTPVADATVWVRPVEGGAAGPTSERSWWRIRDGYALGGVSAADGAFSIGRLVAGEVELFAAATGEDGVAREGAPVRASTSARDVVLVLPAR